MVFKNISLLTILLVISTNSFLLAQIPSGYYSTAEGKTGAELKTALYNIIKNPNVVNYNNLYNAFQTTDIKPNGKVWDVYSDVPGGTPAYEYNLSGPRCGSYSKEGDCFNREHSFPQSWFNSSSPMQSDLFHVIPTDGYVNQKRANYPFGEVSNPTWTSTNGSKLGNNSTAGYTGIVFEPVNEYKGDFARMLMYMATAYEDKISTWAGNGNAGNILAGNSFPAFKTWHINLIAKWHNQDPVSQKEIDRNNAVYAIQGNRNPFIDRPEFAGLIWNFTTSGGNTSIPGTNNQPPIAKDRTIYGVSGVQISLDLKLLVSDEQKSSIRFTPVNDFTSNNVQITITENGILNYYTRTITSGIEDVYNYQVCDVENSCTFGQIRFIISNSAPSFVNTPPSARDTLYRVAINRAFITSLTGLVSDVDGQTLTFNGYNVTLSNGGKLSLNALGLLTYVPALLFEGVEQYQYTVCDPYTCTSANITFRVKPPNRAPIAGTNTITGLPNRILDANISAFVSDPDQDQLRFTPYNGTISGGGRLNLSDIGIITYIPKIGFTGVESYQYQVCDSIECSTGLLHLSTLLLTNNVEETNSSIKIYPNPAKELININNPSNLHLNIELKNLLNQTVFTSSQNESDLVVDLRKLNLSEGLYLLQINGKIYKIFYE